MHTHAQPCPNCGGFGRATVTTGRRDTAGHRQTRPVNCTTCQGRGNR